MLFVLVMGNSRLTYLHSFDIIFITREWEIICQMSVDVSKNIYSLFIPLLLLKLYIGSQVNIRTCSNGFKTKWKSYIF